MGGATDDEAVHFLVFWLVCEVLDLFFYIDSPFPQTDESVLFLTIWHDKIIIISFNGVVVDIFEGFEAFLVTTDGMRVAEPGSVAFLDICLKIEKWALPKGVVLSLDLHRYLAGLSQNK